MTKRYKALASVDLGSNSFRLFMGRIEESAHGVEIRATEGFKESVKLAAGLDSKQILSDEYIAIAVAACARFGERLRNFELGQVRAVATSTLRIAKNSNEVVSKLEQALGFKIQVISGHEEARMIYIGAAHSLPINQRNRLVIDIGGGSTECIIGRDYQPLLMESINVGCISTTKQWFGDGKLTAKAFEQCYLFARSKLAAISPAFNRHGWQDAIGTSGTARALLQICESQFGDALITPKRLRDLQAICIKIGHSDDLKFEGLRSDRRAAMPGGLATMLAVHDEFNLNRMTYGTGALREGVLYDLIGRQDQGDIREVSIANLATRASVSKDHAKRIQDTANALFTQIVASDSNEFDDDQRLLRWAAQLHQVGQSISHDHYHKHSAYIVEHSDLTGFSQTEQKELAWLLLGHAGRLGKLSAQTMRPSLWLLVLSLRLSVILNRRSDENDAAMTVKIVRSKVKLGLSKEWLDEHPMTEFLLTAEIAEWNKTKVFDGVVLETSS